MGGVGKQSVVAHHESKLHIPPLLQQGSTNPVVRLTVRVVNLPGRSEVVQRLVPVAMPPLQNPTVQAHLRTVQTDLRSYSQESCSLHLLLLLQLDACET